jgi:hypothetical protein
LIFIIRFGVDFDNVRLISTNNKILIRLLTVLGRGKIYTTNTQIPDSSLTWLDTGISIKSGGAKLVLLAQP